MWIIDFGVQMSEAEAALFEAPFRHVVEHVKPLRDQNRRESYREKWWIHVEPRPAMRKALKSLPRFLVTPSVAKHRIFGWLSSPILADHQLFVFARDDDFTFGVLHSRFHEIWALRLGTWLGVGNDPRYTASTTFETFPFPRSTDAHRSAITAAAAELVRLRDAWLDPDGASAAELKKRTLTNLYNERPAWLKNAHAALDASVAAAYEWPADITDDEALRRMLALNLERGPA